MNLETLDSLSVVSQNHRHVDRVLFGEYGLFTDYFSGNI